MYFPGLLNGRPPMAPVDPGYSTKALEARRKMLDTVQSGLPSLRFNEIFNNLDDLWESIISENFIFNFKNSRYIKAYDSLEKEFKKIIYSFQVKINELRRQKEKELSKNEEDASELCMEFVTEITDKAEKDQTQSKQDLKSFFKESQFSNILEEWRIRNSIEFDDKASECIDYEVKKMKEYGEEVVQRQKSRDKLRTSVAVQAEEFAKDFKNTVSEVDLPKIFDSTWSRCIDGLSKHSLSKNTLEYRKQCARKELLFYFNKDHVLVGEYAKSLDQNEYRHVEKLSNISQTDFYTSNLSNSCKEKSLLEAKQIVQECVYKNVSLIKKHSDCTSELEPYYLTEIIENCALKKYQSAKSKEEYNITFSQNFQVKVATTIVAYALPLFDENVHQRTPGWLESEKKHNWKIFKSMILEKKIFQSTLARDFVEILETRSMEKLEQK